MQTINFDYYYGAEAEQFTFYRIPKVLMTAPHFKRLSSDAKILYGLMLDRMGLSMKNGWIDGENRVYIFFTLEDVQEALACSHTTGVKVVAELDSSGAGIGLIERVKQGQGRPARIYVKNFNLPNDINAPSGCGSPDFKKVEVKTSKNEKSRLQDCGSADFKILNPNYTNINKTDNNDTERQSINPPAPVPREAEHTRDTKTAIDKIDRYRALIKDNIEYDYLIQDLRKGQIDELVEIMTEAVTSAKDYIYVGQEPKPAAVVKSCLLKLDSSHIRYVLDCLKKNPSKIRNIKGYLLTSLYNAFSTIDNYYTAEVNYDFHGDRD
jgi:hypothetical protein